MSAHARFLRAAELDSTFADGWDALAASRGELADCFDTHAWASGVLAHNPGTAERARVAAVVDDTTGQPLSVLALEHLGGGRYTTLAEDRPRSRVTSTQPDLTQLAEQLAEAGVRDLRLRRLPSRDPATHRLLRALRAAGYRVHARERSHDMLADARDGWEGHRARFRSFHTHCGRVARKIAKHGPHSFDVYTEPERVDEGFEAYADLFPRSWKGPLPPATRAERHDLVRRAAERGWARLYVLRLDGRPAATYLWFRVGSVALWHSTAYDEEFAALGVGNLAMWRAHEHILTEHADGGATEGDAPPTLVDLLPTTTTQKLRLAPEHPPLLDVEAVRGRPLVAAALPVRALARTAQAAAVGRLRARARGRTTAHTETPGGTTA
ncbi:GNAT family N-acetyltransferase [Yinghuangia seranimata]|uniref:GNAT family N-acetyltransferase n=1 Tax=Yinghuangia seranimata TaxID=408067 RepID=UPI00248BBD54|nr:GNAT family N-acetyltransferase [Yinghuangia seranimata]MDI2130215.1 GNAT family N-acetyltransferase [Yinghuangia seranimata]